MVSNRNAVITTAQVMGVDISGVDFMLGHALYMANNLNCVSEDMQNILRYIKLLKSLETFQKAINT